MKRLYAKDVVAKPFGTETPFLFSSRYISPRDAFFPPTIGTSVILKSLNGRTRAFLLNIVSPDVVNDGLFINILGFFLVQELSGNFCKNLDSEKPAQLNCAVFYLMRENVYFPNLVIL